MKDQIFNPTVPLRVKSGAEVIIGDQLRALREQQNLSQGDIEKRTGLLRGYVSRVENGRTIPSIETLEKWARALNVLLYQVFYENDSPSPQPLKAEDLDLWGSEGKDAHYLNRLRRMLSRTRERDRQLLLYMARKLARGKDSVSQQKLQVQGHGQEGENEREQTCGDPGPTGFSSIGIDIPI